MNFSPTLPGIFEPRSDALFSPCRRWRYTLHRIWAPTPGPLMVIGLNPSTADEIKNDPTVTRCINFAHAKGFGGLVMMNAFAYRATDPQVMRRQAKEFGTDVVGPDNDFWLVKMAEEANSIVLAWGNHGLYQGRQNQVVNLFLHRLLWCFGTTKQGAPKHPLYLPGNIGLELFQPVKFPRIPGQEDDGYPD